MKDLDNYSDNDLDEMMEMIHVQMLKDKDYSLTGDYVTLYLYKLTRKIKNG